MTSPPPQPPVELSERGILAMLALAVLIFYLPGIGLRDLWNPDEPRYAEVAREMLASGQVEAFFVPHLNGELYAHKPPLLFWSMAFFGWIFSLFGGGLNEVAARLPSVLAALVAVLFVFRLGRLLFDWQVGLLAALVFGSTVKIAWQGHVGQIDMLLTALVTVAVYWWARGWVEGRPRLSWLFFVFAGFATLAKGPVGLLPPLLAILVFTGWRDRAALKALPVARGLLLWAGIVLCWLGPAIVWGGELYRNEILFKQNVTRYVDPWHHYQPPWYYLQVLPLDFLPWSLILPAALVVAWRTLERAWRSRAFFLVCWVVVTLVFFSLSPAKRTVYILTLYPALALLVGLGLVMATRHLGAASPWWWRLPSLFLTGLAAAAAVAVLVVGPKRPEVDVLGRDLPLILAVVFAVLAAMLARATFVLWQQRFPSFVLWQAAAFGVFVAALFVLVLPRLDATKSARNLAERYLELAPAGEPYALYPLIDPTFLFYTRRHATIVCKETDPLHCDPTALRAFLDRPDRVFLLVERDDWARLDPQPALHEIARDADQREGYILFTNQALPAAKDFPTSGR